MKPHILIFNPDQWRGDVLGHVGNPAAVTPNLDRLVANDAVSFRVPCQPLHRCDRRRRLRPPLRPPCAQGRPAAAASACAVLRGLAGIAPNFPEYAINRFPGLDLHKIVFDQKFPQALKKGTAWWCQVPASTIRSRVVRDWPFGKKNDRQS
jgi:hypothetical protein